MEREDGNTFLTKELVVGDHESIFLLGIESQGKVNKLSRMVANIMQQDYGEVEYIMREILDKIELTEKPKRFLFNSENRRKKSLMNKYSELISDIGKMETGLKLQEAQLLKDTILLEKYAPIIDEVISELECEISYGEDTIRASESNLESSSNDEWTDRLRRRINDLEVSHTALLQFKAQVGLIRENNRYLIERIIAATTVTIPIWRNQVVLMLGINMTDAINAEQDKLAEMAINSSKAYAKAVKKISKDNDIDQLKEIDAKLKETINELNELENKSLLIKDGVDNTIKELINKQ